MDNIPPATANLMPAANSGDKGGAPAAAAGAAPNDNQFGALLAGSLPVDPAAAVAATAKVLVAPSAKEGGEPSVGGEPARGSKDDTIANLMDALAGLQPTSTAVPMLPILPVERAPSRSQEGRNAVVVAHAVPDSHETSGAAERRTRAVESPIATGDHTPPAPATSAHSETANMLSIAESAKESHAIHAADPAAAPEASFAHALHSAAPATATAAAPIVREVPSPVGAPAWNTQLSQQVVWIANARHQVAEIRLNPPDLGPIGITLKLDGDGANQATVQFTSPHAPVRDAIESALPRLREMMADAGITLGQATVGADSFRHGAGHENSGREPSTPAPRDADTRSGVAAIAATTRRATVSGMGLVDTFA